MMTQERGEYYHEIHACISCLGFLEDGEYKKEPDVEDSIKDLLRYLRKERSDTCSVRREMGRANIVVSDLIPLLKTYPSEQSLFEIVIRLLMNLTQPAIICFRNEVPTDKLRLGHYLELEGILRGYKLAFADSELMSVLGSKVSMLLEREWADRSEEDRLLIERILIVVRNILHISQDVNNEKLLDAEVSLHDQVLWAMKIANWDTLLLFLSNSDAEQSAFAFHTLEIMSLLFREQDPAVLAKAGGDDDQAAENDPDKINLQRALVRETEQRRQRVMNESFRHNRFGGCYEIRGMTAVGDKRNVLYHHNPREPDRSFDRDKQQSRVPRNRAPRREREFTRRSSLSVRLFLRRLGLRFLTHCYNPLLRTAMASLQREAAQENDETYYMWAMRFFMAFCRHSRPADIHLISETLNLPSFHWLFNQMTGYLDHLRTDRKKAVQWSRRLQLAVAAYREMLECLNAIDRTVVEEMRRSAHVLKSNVFYMPEYREIFPHLLKRFDQRFQNRSYLCDLVEGTHLLVKMLEKHLNSAGGALIVKKKKGGGARKKKSSAKKEKVAGWTPDRLEAVWSAQADVLASCIRGEGEAPEAENLPRLFDPSTQDGGEEDRGLAIRRALIIIQDQLREEKPGHALALLRLAKELWPEEEALAIEDELLALRDIHMTPIEREPSSVDVDADQADEEGGREEEEEDDAAAERERIAFAKEAKFDMDSYLSQFAHANVVEAYTVLLSEYERNSDHVNDCIVRMFHRLAVRLKAPALLFQLRIFRVFLRFLLEDPLSGTEHYREMRRIAVFILRQFFSVLQTNDKLAVEILFWKSLKEAKCCMIGDYLFEERKSATTPWLEEHDNELRKLFEEWRDKEPEEFGTDTVDLIMEHFSDASKTRRAVIRRLMHLRLISSVKDLKRKEKERVRGSRAPEEEKVWLEEELEELREKISQMEPGQPKPLHMLRALLSFPVTTRQLKTQLLKTGLAPPSWRLRPMRSKRKKTALWGEEEEVDERLLRDTSSSSSSEDEQEVGNHVDLMPVIGELVSTDLEILHWLHKELLSLSETTRDAVDEEGIVLVPIEAVHAEAMESESVIRILRALGLTTPDSSSRYWRLRPAFLQPGAIRERFLSRLGWLSRAADGEDLTEQSALNLSRHSRRSVSSESSDLSSVDESFLKRLRGDREPSSDSGEKSESGGEKRSRKRKKKPKSRLKESEDSDSDSESEDARPRKQKHKRSRKKKEKETEKEEDLEESEKEKEEEEEKVEEEKEKDQKVKEQGDSPVVEKKPRRRKMIRISEIVFSDEEEGGECQDKEEADEDEEELRRALRLSDSDDDSPGKSPQRTSDAENEEPEDLNLSSRRLSSKRRRMAFDSDFEEEAEEGPRPRGGLESEEENQDVGISPMPKKRRLIVCDSDED